jgi:hypothetical protein
VFEGLGAPGLWLGVLLSGLYHGLSPGMGWPLAVSAGLMERREAAVWGALGPIALGHFAAMALVLLPFAALTMLVDYAREIRIGAGVFVAGFGLWLLLNPRHPRALARIPPSKLALWSFAVALAHGAGLLVVPMYLGLCATPGAAAGAVSVAAGNMAVAGLVAAAHALAMIAAAGLVAWAVYRWLGLQFISRSWFNLEAVWAVSLIVAGGVGLWGAV